MRVTSLPLLLALGMAVTGGCGGAGTVSDGQPAGDQPYDAPPSSGYDPVTGQDATPAPYDTPPTDYQAPPVESCARLCAVVTELSCLAQDAGDQTVLPTQAQCETECSASLSDVMSQPCLTEAVDLLTCLFDQAGLTCDLLLQLGDGSLSEGELAQLILIHCGDEGAAYTACQDTQAPPVDNPGGGRCMPNSCNGCPDDCARCDCDGNADACTACINN